MQLKGGPRLASSSDSRLPCKERRRLKLEARAQGRTTMDVSEALRLGLSIEAQVEVRGPGPRGAGPVQLSGAASAGLQTRALRRSSIRRALPPIHDSGCWLPRFPPAPVLHRRHRPLPPLQPCCSEPRRGTGQRRVSWSRAPQPADPSAPTSYARGLYLSSPPGCMVSSRLGLTWCGRLYPGLAEIPPNCESRGSRGAF
jgi:hypothetical protein